MEPWWRNIDVTGLIVFDAEGGVVRNRAGRDDFRSSRPKFSDAERLIVNCKTRETKAH